MARLKATQNKQIAALADAMVEGRITGVPPTVPKDMSYEDIINQARALAPPNNATKQCLPETRTR
jgi:hypothetical protein